MPYLVFYGHDYYPVGGWDDFRKGFDSRDEAIGFARGLVANSPTQYSHQVHWSHVVCISESKVVARFEGDGGGEVIEAEATR